MEGWVARFVNTYMNISRCLFDAIGSGHFGISRPHVFVLRTLDAEQVSTPRIYPDTL
jgi:hypothetical protein